MIGRTVLSDEDGRVKANGIPAEVCKRDGGNLGNGFRLFYLLDIRIK
jgi:hypothetical protein